MTTDRTRSAARGGQRTGVLILVILISPKTGVNAVSTPQQTHTFAIANMDRRSETNLPTRHTE